MILDINNNSKHLEISITENFLQKNIIKYFNILFPEYRILNTEYKLQGDVRKFGISGRIDIFALNLSDYRLAVFELKKDNNKNVLFQAIDYTDFISENYNLIILSSLNLSIEEKDKLLKSKLKPEIILIAKSFNHPTIRRIENVENKIRLIEYKAFENNLLYFETICNKNDNNKIVFYKSEEHKFENIDSSNVNLIIKESIKNLDESYYLIDNSVLVINPTILYNSFKQISSKFDLIHLPRSKFMKLIRESEFYIEERNAMRFKSFNTSAIIIKL